MEEDRYVSCVNEGEEKLQFSLSVAEILSGSLFTQLYFPPLLFGAAAAQSEW